MVAEEQAPVSTAPAAALRTVGGIDTLLALQGQDNPPEPSGNRPDRKASLLNHP